MRSKRLSARTIGRKRAAPIKTTLMDLVHAITDVTEDDTQVLALVKNIFASHKVRLARSLAPVRLVNSARSKPARPIRKNPAYA